MAGSALQRLAAIAAAVVQEHDRPRLDVGEHAAHDRLRPRQLPVAAVDRPQHGDHPEAAPEAVDGRSRGAVRRAEEAGPRTGRALDERARPAQLARPARRFQVQQVGVAVGVVGDLAAARGDVPQHRLHAARRAPDDEEGGMRVMAGEHAQDRRRTAGGPVVERQRDHAPGRAPMRDAAPSGSAARRSPSDAAGAGSGRTGMRRVGAACRRRRAERRPPRGQTRDRPIPASPIAATTSQNTRRRRRCRSQRARRSALLRSSPSRVAATIPQLCHQLRVEASEHAANVRFVGQARAPGPYARRSSAPSAKREGRSARDVDARLGAQRPRPRRPRRRRARA